MLVACVTEGKAKQTGDRALFHRILVPLDFTEKNVRALEIALGIAQQNNANVALLHVIEIVEHIPFDEMKSFYGKLENAARERLGFPASMFLEKGLVVDPDVVYGNRTEEIVKYATSNGVDLIVLSSHRISVEQPTKGWGSISHKVALFSQCPVLLVK